MATKTSIILPRVYQDNSIEQKYAKYNGMPKISYSQLTSWNDPKYRNSYIRSYFLGIRDESGVFAEFGSATGTFVESIGTGSKECHEPYEHLLSDSDREFLSKKLDYPENSVYEDYVVYNYKDLFVIEGYIDRSVYLPDNYIIIEDFKTGSISKKKDYYAHPDYNQTRLYAYVKESEGYHIDDCRVVLLDRAGNGSDKHPMRLTGDLKIIPTPYDKKETEKFLKTVEKTVQDISKNYQHFLKLFR